MFNPSEKQRASVIKMSEAQSIYPVENFDSYKQFQEHFTNLMDGMKKLKKASRFKKAVREWKVDLKKLEEKKFDYYEDNEGVLESKAREYIGKYNPSIKKLGMYLSKKTRNPEQIEQIIENIAIDEETIIRNIIREKRDRLIQPYSKITQHLYNRLFEGALINELISSHKEQDTVETFIDGINQKIELLCLKRISYYKIKFYLRNLDIDSSRSEYLLETYYDSEKQFDLAVAYAKSLLSYKDEKHVVKTLEKDQYRYDEIKQIILEAKCVYN